MKRFNAKRTLVTILYEFLDGSEQNITVQSLSTAEFEGIDTFRSNPTNTGSDTNKKAVGLLLLKNESAVVEKIINEQFTECSIGEFTNALLSIIEEEKKGKLDG